MPHNNVKLVNYDISHFTRIAKTAVIFNDLNPKWNETFLVN